MNSESGSDDAGMTDHHVARAAGGGALCPESYEVAFALEEGPESHGQQTADEAGAREAPLSPYSPFILVSNLRAHLYVALEKNAWLQKRINELEEERNFLRCQLDRLIVGARGRDAAFVEFPEWREGAWHAALIQPAAPAGPPSPMTTRSGMTLKRRQGLGARPHRAVPVKREFEPERERFYADEEFLEERRDHPERDGDSSPGAGAEEKGPSVKMRRIFISRGRERQRVKDPDGVLIRYKKILSTYQRVRSMSRAFQIHGVDRNTMASTSPIAELLLVAPHKMAEVGEFEAAKEKLLDYARRCYKIMDQQTQVQVESMKKSHKLLPISYRFRN